MKEKNRPGQTVGDPMISPEPDIPDAEIPDENLTICLREDMSIDMEIEECEILSDDEYFLDDNPTLNLTDEMTITGDKEDEDAIVLGDDDYFMDDCPTLNLTDEMAILTGRTDLLSPAPDAISGSEPDNGSDFFLDIRELKDEPEIENTWDEFLKNSEEGFDHPTIQLLPPAIKQADVNPFADEPDSSFPENIPSDVPPDRKTDDEADVNVFPEAATPARIADDTETDSGDRDVAPLAGSGKDETAGLAETGMDLPAEPDIPEDAVLPVVPAEAEDDLPGHPETDSDIDLPPEPDIPDPEKYEETQPVVPAKLSAEEDTETLGPPDTSDLVPETEEVTIELNPETVIKDRLPDRLYNGQDATLELSVQNIIEAEPDYRMDDWAGGGMADEDYTFDLPPRNVVDIKQISRRESPWHYTEDDPTFDRPPVPLKTSSEKEDDSTFDLPDQHIVKTAEEPSDDDQPFELTSQNIVDTDDFEESPAGNWASDIDPEMYGNTVFGVVPDTAGDRTLELPVRNIVVPEPGPDDDTSLGGFPDSAGDRTLELPVRNIVVPEPGPDDDTSLGGFPDSVGDRTLELPVQSIVVPEPGADGETSFEEEPDSDEDQAIDIPLQDIVPPDAAGDPTLDLPEQDITGETSPDDKPDSGEDMMAIDLPVQNIVPDTSADRTLDLPEQDVTEPEPDADAETIAGREPESLTDTAAPVEDIMAAISSIEEILEKERDPVPHDAPELPAKMEAGPDDDTVVNHIPEIPEHQGKTGEDRSPEPPLKDTAEIPVGDVLAEKEQVSEPAGNETVGLPMQHVMAESPDSDTVVDITLQEVPDPDSTTVQIPEPDSTVDLKYHHILESAGDESPEISGFDAFLENILKDDADPDAPTVRIPEADETSVSRFEADVALADDAEDEEEITLVMPQREVPEAAEPGAGQIPDVDAETVVIPSGDGDKLAGMQVFDEDAAVPDDSEYPDESTLAVDRDARTLFMPEKTDDSLVDAVLRDIPPLDVQIPEPDATVDLEYTHISETAGDESPETSGFDTLLENLLRDDADTDSADVALADDEEDEEEITLVMPQQEIPGAAGQDRPPDIDAETVDIPFDGGDDLPEIRVFDEEAGIDDSFTDGNEYPDEDTLAVDRDARTLFAPGKTGDTVFPALPAITDTGDEDDAEEPFTLTSDDILEPEADRDEKSSDVSDDEEEEETLVLSSHSFTDTSDTREEDPDDPDTFDLEKAVDNVLKLDAPDEESSEADTDDTGDAEALDAATAFLLDDDEIAGMIHDDGNDLSEDAGLQVSPGEETASEWQDRTLVLDEATIIHPNIPEAGDATDTGADEASDWRDRTLVLDEATVVQTKTPESEEGEWQDRTLALDEATIIQPNIPEPEEVDGSGADLHEQTLVLDEKTVVRPLTTDDDIPEPEEVDGPGADLHEQTLVLDEKTVVRPLITDDDIPASRTEPSQEWPDSTLVLDETTAVPPETVPDKPAELLTEDEEDDDVLDLDAGTIIAFRSDGEIDIDAAIEDALNDEEEQTLVLEDEKNMVSSPEIPESRYDNIDENILDLDARTLVAPGEPEMPVPAASELKTAKALMEEDDVVTLDPGTMIISRQDMFPDSGDVADQEQTDFISEYEGSTEHVPDADMPGPDLDEAVSDALGREHDEPGEPDAASSSLSRNLLSPVLLRALRMDDGDEPPTGSSLQPESGVTAIELLDGLEEVPDEPAGMFQAEDDFLSMLEKEIQAGGNGGTSEGTSPESVASRLSSGIEITCKADISGIKSLVKDSASNVIEQRRFEGFVSPEKLEQMLERVIERIFTERIEKMLGNAIEKSVQDEIQKVRKFLLEEIAIEEGD